MPDVKDLAQAAQGAAAPENVNVVEKTASVNQPVVDTDNQNSASVNQPVQPVVDTDNQKLHKWKPLMMLLIQITKILHKWKPLVMLLDESVLMVIVM